MSDRETGEACENCGKDIEVGQVILPYDDVTLHADCENPFSLTVERNEGDPEPVVLLGDPMRYYRLPKGPAGTPEGIT